ncbi:MAG: ComEC/Rec2 family competence protein [Prolixibacteraceae bacterium]|nr:ComEC/Rec2 family competence protein [Prolixibacteraceae bacterium]
MPATQSILPKIPFIRITGLFLIGILLNHYLSLDAKLVAILCTLLISALIFFWANSSYSTIRIQNFLISVGIVCIGIFYPVKVKERPLPSFERKDYFMAEVCQKPAEKARTYQTVLLIQNKLLPKPEKVMAYFSKEKFDSTLSTGDQIIILAKPQIIKNMGNPFEFDYQSMIQARNIWFSVYLTNGNYLKTRYKVHRVIYTAEQVRDKLISILTKVIHEKEERSVISALTLGYRAEIGQDTMDYFASTGAMHVLSVSGLHVGLIYFILGLLLSFLKRGKTGKAIFACVMILFLWIYAFISGFSPSVQRATVMFSFVIIGNGLRRPVNIYNTLMASALLLMLLNPDVIFDIGFQLSYLAVFGIILIQPALYKLIDVTNPVAKWIWSLTTVSVAAQLTTFPLGLFYFNQFPNLFWLSNFIVIPATTLIIWLTLVFFSVCPIPGLALILGIVIEKITHWMLVVLKFLDSLPYAVSQGIVLSQTQVFILFSGIIAIILFFTSKRKGWLLSFLVAILLFQLSNFYEKSKVFNQREIIVYNSKSMMIHLVNGRTNYLITNDVQNLSENEISTFEKVRNHLELNPTQIISLDQSCKSEYGDLVINKNQLKFINATISSGSVREMKKISELITLKIQATDSNTATIEKNIYTGNSDLFGESKPEYFCTKLNGAFLCQIK